MTEVAKSIESSMIAAYKGGANDRMGDPNIHVSNLINFCPRAYWLCWKHDRSFQAFKYFGIQTKWDFDIGHAVQRIQVDRLSTQDVIYGGWQCRQCGRFEIGLPRKKTYKCAKCKCRSWRPVDLRVELKIPVKIKGKKTIHIVVVGHIDYVYVIAKLLGHITDAKSIKAEYFDKLTNPNIDYRRQGQLYMWLANHPDIVFPGHVRKGDENFKIDPETAIIAYGVKGSRKMPFKFFEVAQDHKFIQKIEKALKALVKGMETNKAPTQICHSQHNMMAKQCVVRDICFDQVLPGMGRKRR